MTTEIRYSYHSLYKVFSKFNDICYLSGVRRLVPPLLAYYFKTYLYELTLSNACFNNFYFIEKFTNLGIKSCTAFAIKAYSLIYNVVKISFLEYIDFYYFKNFLHVECLNFTNTFRFFSVLLLRNVFQFITVPVNQYLLFEKNKLDRCCMKSFIWLGFWVYFLFVIMCIDSRKNCYRCL